MNAEMLAELSQATLASSFAVVLVLLLRRPLRRQLGMRAAYFLWLLVPMAVVAVLVPAPLQHGRIVTAATAAIGLAEPISVAWAPAGESSLPQALLAGWLAGMLFALGFFASRQARFARLVTRRANQPFDEIAGHGPAVSGLFKPRIVLPADFRDRYNEQEQALVLAHEQAHVWRGDIQAQAVAVALRCVFWFNPLIHLAAARFRFDQELACDATVIARFPAARRIYGDAMLKTQLAELGLPIGCYWQSSHPLKERITMLKSSVPGNTHRRLAQAGLVAGCLAIACGVWAAQSPAPTAAVVADALFDSRFDINVDGVPSGKPRTLSKVGESVAFAVGEGSKRWDVELTYRSTDDDKIDVSGVIRHDGSVVSRPRLLILPGIQSAVGVSTPDGKSLLEFKFTVTSSKGDNLPANGPAVAAPAAMPVITRVTAADTLTTPVYPQEAKGISGKIVLKVLVGADGTVKDVKVESAQPSHVFDASAIKAAYSWKFTPASRASDGKKVEGWVRVPVSFEADKKAAPES